MSGRFAVQADDIFHTKRLEHSRNGESANRVHAVDSDGKVPFRNRFGMNKVKIQHFLHMIGQVVLVGHMSELVHFGKGEIFALGDSQHFFAFGIIEEFAFLVQQFKGIPLFRVV